MDELFATVPECTFLQCCSKDILAPLEGTYNLSAHGAPCGALYGLQVLLLHILHGVTG